MSEAPFKLPLRAKKSPIEGVWDVFDKEGYCVIASIAGRVAEWVVAAVNEHERLKAQQEWNKRELSDATISLVAWSNKCDGLRAENERLTAQLAERDSDERVLQEHINATFLEVEAVENALHRYCERLADENQRLTDIIEGANNPAYFGHALRAVRDDEGTDWAALDVKKPRSGKIKAILTHAAIHQDQAEQECERLAVWVGRLRAALLETTERTLFDGSPCWCPDFYFDTYGEEGKNHRDYCAEARAALEPKP